MREPSRSVRVGEPVLPELIADADDGVSVVPTILSAMNATTSVQRSQKSAKSGHEIRSLSERHRLPTLRYDRVTVQLRAQPNNAARATNREAYGFSDSSNSFVTEPMY